MSAEHSSPRAFAAPARATLAAGAALLLSTSASSASAQLAPPPPLGSTPPPNGAYPPPSGAYPPPNGAYPQATSAPPVSASTPPPVAPGEDKDEDSGRGLSWFWLEAQGGYEHLDLTTFDGSSPLAVPFGSTTADGGVVSAGLGAQLVFVTLGARARFGFFEDYRLSQVGGELGFRIPLGQLEPRFDLGGGYAGLGNFDELVADSITVEGFYARVGAGLDFYPVEVMSLGLHASFDVLGMTSAPVAGAELAAALEEQTSLGYGLALQASAGLHF